MYRQKQLVKMVWSGRKPWSELSDKMDIFKAVRDEKKTLQFHLETENEDIPDGYEDLMKRCCKYKANQRPLIDVVRVEVQNLMEKAARVDLRRRRMVSSSSNVTTSPPPVDDDRNAVGDINIEMTSRESWSQKEEVVVVA